jgi:hypothetical protein
VDEMVEKQKNELNDRMYNEWTIAWRRKLGERRDKEVTNTPSL